MKKILLAVLALCVTMLCIGFASCSKKESAAAGAASGSAGAKTTLTFHHFSTEQEVRDGNAGAVSFRYAIAEWEKAHPNVSLEQTILDNVAGR
jgi:ABC-type glycerol-3-phosphate transport system substrate-binding protein